MGNRKLLILHIQTRMIEDGTLFYTLPIHESLRQKEIILDNPKCNLKILYSQYIAYEKQIYTLKSQEYYKLLYMFINNQDKENDGFISDLKK
ncbi:LOW QUALITY PROTEIN: hypothetical protein V1477_012618 [Vespula maculifrons]|uniref:Uncharacterized protein n=1 Tax=Vespula maculifrons TaxID=7453 RepID=A0ABD2BU21_VESMC